MANDGFPYTEKQQRWWFANLDEPLDTSDGWTQQSQAFRGRINALVERKEAELRMRVTGARIQVRPKVHRGVEGFSIAGRDQHGRSVRIFTKTRLSAERIRNRVVSGLDVRLEDFGG